MGFNKHVIPLIHTFNGARHPLLKKKCINFKICGQWIMGQLNRATCKKCTKKRRNYKAYTRLRKRMEEK